MRRRVIAPVAPAPPDAGPAAAEDRFVTAEAPPLAAVTPVAPGECARTGGVFGRAFYDDPQWVALVPDPEVRRARLPEMFQGIVRLTAAARGRPERTAGFEAVALWLAPGRDIGLGAVLRSRFASLRVMSRVPFRDGRRIMAVLRAFDRRRQALMPEPHWYLLALATDPAHQRQGYGSQLVRHGLLRADRDAVPVYLEAETEVNAPFYERLGFETLEEATIEEIDLRFSLMVRRPLARDDGAGSAPNASPPLAIRDARAGDRASIARIFTASFRDFPPLASIVGTDAGADDRRLRMMQATLAAPPWKLHVLVAEQEGRVVGALTYADSPDCMAVSGLQARTYLRVYGPRLPAMVRGTAAILRMHPRTPHRHLPMVGVDPACQGRGIGALLLAEYTRRCDEAGLPGYLETVRYTEPGRPSHERLYGRHGFHVEHVAALDPEWSLLGMMRPVGGAVPGIE
jgi:ribosomal protein S18 acetylase RimI-like enzyme